MSTATLNPILNWPLALREEPLFELVNGVLKEKPPKGLFANILATILATSINTFALPRRLGMAINQTIYQVEEKNSRRPDVSYYELSKFPSMDVLLLDPPVFEREPNLAIEVVSPSNTIADMTERIAHFFKTGVQLVWVVLPQSKQVYVYQSVHEGLHDSGDGRQARRRHGPARLLAFASRAVQFAIASFLNQGDQCSPHISFLAR
jgi:Uma2 family endonuclease